MNFHLGFMFSIFKCSQYLRAIVGVIFILAPFFFYVQCCCELLMTVGGEKLKVTVYHIASSSVILCHCGVYAAGFHFYFILYVFHF